MKPIPISMENARQTARWTGILFLIPLLAYGGGNAWMEFLRTPAEGLAALAGRGMAFGGAALLLFLNSLAVVGIAVLLHPLLARQHPRAALTYLCTRLAEALLLLGGMIALLLLPGLGEAARLHPEAAGTYQSLADLAVHTNFFAFQVAMLVLGLGSLLPFAILGRARLLPRGMAAWGLLGYGLLALGALLELLGLPFGLWLSLPGGLFEAVLGVWLIVKGFYTGALPA
jgi:hypothetical protein